MCKHVAAVMYGVGSRLDVQPELLFRLRAVNENDLVGDIGKVLPLSKQAPVPGKVLEADDMAALFGLDMGDAAEPAVVPPPVGTKPPAVRKKGASKVKAVLPTAVPAVRGRKAASEKNTSGSRTAVPTARPDKGEPKPVEWWKSAPPKTDGRTRVPKVMTAAPGAGRRARAAS
jgi:hypothetical protein